MQLSSRAADIVADESSGFCVCKSFADVIYSKIVLITDVQVALLGSDGQRAYRKTFNDAVRVSFEYGPVHERARVALVAVAGHILREVVISECRAPFASGREACASTSSEARSIDFVDYLFRSHAECLPEAFISA